MQAGRLSCMIKHFFYNLFCLLYPVVLQFITHKKLQLSVMSVFSPVVHFVLQQ
jgi:hypothetical protein